MEFSSIILGEPWSAEHQHSGATDTSSTSIGSHHDDDHEDDDARPVEFGFLDVLDVLRQYQVPSLDLCYAIGTTEIDEQQTSVTGCSLERKAVRANRRFSHMLGGGYSATVLRHVTKEDVFALATEGDVIAERDPELVVKAGTVIAFKKITPRPSGNGASDLARRSGAFRTICQEIKVSKHAQLRSHENISGILYVAWQRSEEFPWLALSLAAFGTLEDILTAPGERPTSKHKLNLTADVAFGVAALHRADIIHGDLKPANVLVHHHHDSNRQIIGKITDFGGSVSAGEGHPSIGTPLWCAPEVAATTAKTDWKLADVWSYGLIVASIWSERSSRSCYLEKLISEHLEGSVRNARLFLIKSEPDASSDSIVSRCMDLDFTIRPLLLNTLSRQPTRRLTLDTIISTSLRSICEGLKRDIPIDCPYEPVPLLPTFKVWSYGYRKREFEYQQTVYEHLVEASSPLRATLELEIRRPEDLLAIAHDSPSSAEELDSRPSLEASNVWQSVAWKTLVSSLDYRFRSGRQPIVAYQVAVSQCLQLGCELDENELVTWVYVAARGGHPQASWIAPLLERSCAKSSASILGDLHYSMVCLAIGACIGSVPSLLALKQADLGMYQSTLALIQSRERPDFQLKSTIELFKDFLDAPRLDMSTCSLMDAIKSQNVDRARALLESHSTDTTNMFDREGFNVLHALTLLEDDDAASLALSVYVHGANLLGVATLSEPTAVSLYARHIEGTPLYWTAIKGMPRLFKVLLELHVESSTPVIDPLRMAMQAAMLHHHEILYQILAQRDITPEAFLDDRSFGAEQLYIQALLGASLTPADIIPFSRRLLHGRNVHVAQRQTLNIVLARGADVFEPCFGFEDFTEGSGGYTGVSLAISNDDDRALKLFLGHLQASKVEVGNLEAMSSILQLCTVKNALRCFRVVLDTFPQLVNFLSTKDGLSTTLTPLNMAARRPRSDYALALLEREADTTICHEDFSPLARAILDGHLETAEVIYSFCSDVERQKTFGYNEVTGFTLMGRVMSAWIATQKSKPLIDIVKWINDKGGAMLECDIVHKTPVWNMILSKRASSAADQAHLDDMMMATLFDLFPDKLDQPDPGGLYPLHHATMNGHRTAISLLLDRNVNIDCESTGLVVPEGMTPLTCAALRLETDAPSDVSKGGRLEVRMWRARMREILQFLLSKGATIGKHPRPGDFYRSLQYMVPGVNCFNASGNDPDPDDEMNWPQDTWPLKLPRDETSSEESAREGRTNFERGLLRNRGEYVKRMTDEEKQDLAQYGAWLLRKAKVRHERYNKFGIDWAGEDEELGDLPLSWQPWHSLLPLVGIVNQGRSWLM